MIVFFRRLFFRREKSEIERHVDELQAQLTDRRRELLNAAIELSKGSVHNG